jgi:hypothetical protein
MTVLGLVQKLILIWFGLSILVTIGSNLSLVGYLARRGIKLKFGLVSIPGYLELKYLTLCNRDGRSPDLLLKWRTAMLASLVLSSLFAIHVFSSLR